LETARSYDISKQVVWDAYKRVKANRGSAGVDRQSIEDFERGLKDNLYKIWNRMSSGSYFPPEVRTVPIPKKSGGTRILGIPTVVDRVAQMVVKIYLEPKVEPHFHQDSYGYRPKKSAKQAVAVTRKRCWEYDWVLEFDIKGLFDTIDHELLMRVVRKHTEIKWILLYIERWLKAPFRNEDGTMTERIAGTPQGGVVSPLLANMFLHYVFDQWMTRKYSQNPFARYADDGVIHCRGESEANVIHEVLACRFRECKLALQPEKTKIVYCKDEKRRGDHTHITFDFLGFTFKARRSMSKYGMFMNFAPGVSNKAATLMRQKIRRWNIHLRSDKSIEELAQFINPIIRGWINYYGSFYKTALYPTLQNVNYRLERWGMRKCKRLKSRRQRAKYWLGCVARKNPNLLAHWQMGAKPAAG